MGSRADTGDGAPPPARDAERWRLALRSVGVVRVLTVAAWILGAAAVAWLCIIAAFRIERTARAWDAFAEFAAADRIARLGEPFYVAGTDHKGPVWLGAYWLAAEITTPNVYWFAIAGFAVVTSLLTAVAVTVFLRGARASLPVALTTGAVLLITLLFGPEEYSEVFYSRNITAMLLAIAFALAVLVPGRSATRTRVLAAAAGVAVGLAVQTVPSEALTGIVVGALLTALAAGPAPGRSRRMLVTGGVWAASALAALLSAHVYYLMRGGLSDFWDQWWTYNNHYAQSTGRSYPEILSKGLDDFWGYYVSDRWGLGLVVVAFALVTAVRWRGMTWPARFVSLAAAGWWLAACLSIVLAQRFFSHYLVAALIPVAVMGGLAAAGLLEAVRGRLPEWTRWLAAPLAAIAVALAFVAVPSENVRGWSSQVAGFDGFDAAAVDRDRDPDPRGYWGNEVLLERAVARLFTDPDEYAYAHTIFPSYYERVGRSSATRYIESRWLIGEIYGGATDPKYILPGTERKFRDDLRRTPPAIVTDYAERRILPGSFVADALAPFLSEGPFFSPGTARIFVRPERVAERTRSVDPRPADLDAVTARPGTGWQADEAGALTWMPGAIAPEADVAVLAERRCVVVTGEVFRSPSEPGALGFVVGRLEPFASDFASVTLIGDALVRSEIRTPDGYLHTFDLAGSPDPGWSPFRFVVRDQAAGLMVDGRLVGAVSLDVPGDQVGLRPWEPSARLRDLQVGDAADCPRPG